MLGVILVAVMGGELAVERAVIRESVQTIHRLAATALVPRRGEMPEVTARRDALVRQLKWLEKHAEDCASRKYGAQGVLNALDLARNTVDGALSLCASPEEQLAWLRVSIRVAEATHRLLLKREFDNVPDPQRPQVSQAEFAVRLRRQHYRAVLAECVPESR